MSKGFGLLGSFGLGAAVAYFADPRTGHARRARLEQRLIGQTHDFRRFMGVAGRDLGNRTRGVFGDLRYRRSGRTVSDDVLVERVAAKMGRYCSHAHAIGIGASDGVVTLRGPILRHEVEPLLSAVMAVPGVREINNELEPHKLATGISDLQGGQARRGDKLDVLHENWSPATRLIVGSCAAALTVQGLRAGLMNKVLAVIGALLFGRAATNIEMARMLGLKAGHRGLRFQKTISINAPLDQVHEFFANFTNFPTFMRNVKDVRGIGGGRSHWICRGPGGVEVSWNAVVTRHDPERVLAWCSEPDSLVDHAGIIRFEERDEGRTRVSIRMVYNPPAGVIGHAVAALFGSDPKSEMDADLVRAKSFLETGRPAHDAAARGKTMPFMVQSEDRQSAAARGGA